MSYVRVSILGTQVSEEVWSINPVFDPTGEFPGGVSQTALDAAALAIANLAIPTQLRAQLSTAATRNAARLEVRDDVSDELLGLSIQGSSTASAGTSVPVMPPQSAIVCSIRTATPGASGRGRIYWPAMGTVIGADGRLSSANVTAILADFKTYLLGMRSALTTAWPTIGFDLAVRSKTTKTTPHAVRIQVGNVVDTQRRRRDSIPEAYQTLTFP
jgi:hypothetical protein